MTTELVSGFTIIRPMIADSGGPISEQYGVVPTSTSIRLHKACDELRVVLKHVGATLTYSSETGGKLLMCFRVVNPVFLGFFLAQALLVESLPLNFDVVDNTVVDISCRLLSSWDSLACSFTIGFSFLHFPVNVR